MSPAPQPLNLNPRTFLAPPQSLTRPRCGGQVGLDGNRDPLQLGAGGVDSRPDGVPPAQQGGDQAR